MASGRRLVSGGSSVALSIGRPEEGRDPAQFQPTIRLHLLKGFELLKNREPVILPLTAQRLLAFLALQERPLLRPFVAGMLWTDWDEARSSANLRSTLWKLHRPRLSLVRSTSNQLSLSANVVVDAIEAMHLARRLLDNPDQFEASYIREICLAGELLPDWYDEWVVIERERLRQLRLNALESVAEKLREAGRYAEAVEAGLAAVAIEPLRETAHKVVIQAHLAVGNLADAIRQFRSYEKVLRDELSLKPSPQIRDLMQSVTS